MNRDLMMENEQTGNHLTAIANERAAANEWEAAQGFSAQAPGFDAYSASNTIIQYKRERVREHAERFLPVRSAILELNAGTGEDALYFAGRGHRVHATDIAEGMLQQLAEKAGPLNEEYRIKGLSGRVTHELCSFSSLGRLANKGPFDMVFSDFAGLNCTAELDKVLRSCEPLLKPGGVITVVLLPAFCLWESLLVFKGKGRTAFRRFAGREGALSHVEGHHFRCWYYNPSYVQAALKESFEVMALEGLCTIVPPSYIEGFAEKYPGAYRFLRNSEDRLKSGWPWKYIGDYYIMTLRKK